MKFAVLTSPVLFTSDAMYCFYLTGLASVISVYILGLSFLDTKNIADMLEWIFYIIIPNFCFGFGLMQIYTNYANKKICTSFDFGPLCTSLAASNGTNPCCPGKIISHYKYTYAILTGKQLENS